MLPASSWCGSSLSVGQQLRESFLPSLQTTWQDALFCLKVRGLGSEPMCVASGFIFSADVCRQRSSFIFLALWLPLLLVHGVPSRLRCPCRVSQFVGPLFPQLIKWLSQPRSSVRTEHELSLVQRQEMGSSSTWPAPSKVDQEAIPPSLGHGVQAHTSSLPVPASAWDRRQGVVTMDSKVIPVLATKTKPDLGVVAHSCKASTVGGRGRTVASSNPA